MKPSASIRLDVCHERSNSNRSGSSPGRNRRPGDNPLKNLNPLGCTNIKILYDNQAESGFHSGWGFSALIDDSTLFDTGENAEALLANLRAFDIEPEQIQRVVLSHEDWDHVGGIAILRQCGPVTVYVPISFSKAIKKDIIGFSPAVNLVEIRNALEVEPNMIVTPQIGIVKKEISLAIRTVKGIVLIVGCSHPGLDRIMARASEYDPIHAVIGGFHGFKKLKTLREVPVIIPTHCTKRKQDLLDMYPNQVRHVAAGMQICIKEKQ